MTQINEIEQRLLNRIHKPWGRYISCGEGWYQLLGHLDKKLSYLDPDYKIHQVKEKFGTLRFYYETQADDLIRDIMTDCVSAHEYASSHVCEYCGSYAAKSQTDGYWVKTACVECWAKKQEERKKRDQSLTELVKFNEENGLYDLPLEDVMARQYTTAEAKEREEKYNA